MVVRVDVPLGEVEIEADPHQGPRGQQTAGDRFLEHQQCEDGADERRGGEVGAGPCSSKKSQSEDEQDEAHPIA